MTLIMKAEINKKHLEWINASHFCTSTKFESIICTLAYNECTLLSMVSATPLISNKGKVLVAILWMELSDVIVWCMVQFEFTIILTMDENSVGCLFIMDVITFGANATSSSVYPQWMPDMARGWEEDGQIPLKNDSSHWKCSCIWGTNQITRDG